jgi:hypothetical protein
MPGLIGGSSPNSSVWMCVGLMLLAVRASCMAFMNEVGAALRVAAQAALRESCGLRGPLRGGGVDMRSICVSFAPSDHLHSVKS